MNRKTRKTVLAFVLVVMVAAVAVIYRLRRFPAKPVSVVVDPTPAKIETPALPATASPTKDFQPAASEMEQPVVEAADVPIVPAPKSVDQAIDSSRLIRDDEVMARVNDVSIFGKDLLPFCISDSSREKSLSPEMRDYLLNRAIDRELVFQAARMKGVDLTENQSWQLQHLRADLSRQDMNVVALAQNDPAKVEFELRDPSSLMLRASLLEQAGVSSPYVTAQVEQYYQTHSNQFGELPEGPVPLETAWQQIDYHIRLILTPEHQVEYRQKVDRQIEQLWQEADIATF